jgi:tetratricopeptide (TPR) repeat protein
MVSRLRAQSSVALVACIVLIAIGAAYWPGLSGDFIFDDFANLDVVGAFGNPWRWPEFLFYITSGGADPTGRPVALLTFLIDGSSWPTDPWPFKRTNLVLHLLNAALLGWTIARLDVSKPAGGVRPPASPWVPLLAAAFWAAHPFFVSTTLYVVQREAMLPMTFVLLAILSWSAAVHAFEHRKPLRAWTWCVAGFGIATVLATLSKANGVLAPLLAGICYVYFLRARLMDRTARRRADMASMLLLAIPALLVVAYLVHSGLSGWSPEPIAGRNWSRAERLLSQPRALWDYVGRLAIPRAGGGGVFVEGFTASRGWLEPWTTLPAFVALVLSMLLAWWLRQRWRAASFAWTFFLGAHLLESSTVPLELYFEHRNYLPAMFLGWPLAQAMLRSGPQLLMRRVSAVVLVVVLLLLTHQRAAVWGNPTLMDALTASQEADSARAQVAAANVELNQGKAGAAVARMRALASRHPTSIDVMINAISIECQGGDRLAPELLASTHRALRESDRWNFGLYLWLGEAARTPAMMRCEGFGIPGLMSLVEAAEQNPQAQTSIRRRDLRHVRGQIALALGDPSQALVQFNEALALAPEAQYALVQAAVLGNANDSASALAHLDEYERLKRAAPREPIRDMPALHRRLLDTFGYYDDELKDLRRRLEADHAQYSTPASEPRVIPHE